QPPVLRERLPGRAHHARRVLHQRHPGRPAHRSDHDEDGRGLRGPPRMESAAAPTKPQSYFVRDLFTKVVIPDRDVAVRSSGLLKKQRLLQILMTAGALAASSAFLFLPISSYLENRRLVEDALTFVETLGHARTARDGAGSLSAATLESVREMALRLERFEA